MVPSADEKGKNQPPKTKSRRKHMVNVGQLMTNTEMLSEIVLNAFRYAPEYAFLKKWGCPIQKLVFDPRASEVLDRMYKLWPRLTPAQRRLYLLTAEGIAEAEKAKNVWNPKVTRARHIHVAKTAVASAKLVREISLIFPPPWVGDETKIGELVFVLASFISGTIDATFPWSKGEAIRNASDLLRTAKTRIAKKTGGMRWELLRDLVWLASGKNLDLDERAVRRYLSKQPSEKNLADAYWRTNWDLMRQAFLLAKEWRAQAKEPDKPNQDDSWFAPLAGATERRLDSELFERAVGRFLTNPRSSITSR